MHHPRIWPDKIDAALRRVCDYKAHRESISAVAVSVDRLCLIGNICLVVGGLALVAANWNGVVPPSAPWHSPHPLVAVARSIGMPIDASGPATPSGHAGGPVPQPGRRHSQSALNRRGFWAVTFKTLFNQQRPDLLD